MGHFTIYTTFSGLPYRLDARARLILSFGLGKALGPRLRVSSVFPPFINQPRCHYWNSTFDWRDDIIDHPQRACSWTCALAILLVREFDPPKGIDIEAKSLVMAECQCLGFLLQRVHQRLSTSCHDEADIVVMELVHRSHTTLTKALLVGTTLGSSQSHYQGWWHHPCALSESLQLTNTILWGRCGGLFDGTQVLNFQVETSWKTCLDDLLLFKGWPSLFCGLKIGWRDQSLILNLWVWTCLELVLVEFLNGWTWWKQSKQIMRD